MSWISECIFFCINSPIIRKISNLYDFVYGKYKFQAFIYDSIFPIQIIINIDELNYTLTIHSYNKDIIIDCYNNFMNYSRQFININEFIKNSS